MGDVNPQLALWATDIAPAMRASANIQSDPTPELTRRREIKSAMTSRPPPLASNVGLRSQRSAYLRTRACQSLRSTSWRSQRNVSSPQRELWVRVQPSGSEPQRGDINLGGHVQPPRIMSRASRACFLGDVNPQLALWATDIAPAMRASANMQSDPTAELTRRREIKSAMTSRPRRSRPTLDCVPSVAHNLERALVKVYGQPVGEANEILVAHSIVGRIIHRSRRRRCTST
jgi:hypothetical protein